MTIPDPYTRADLFADAAETTGLGGMGMDDLDKMLDFGDRVVKLISKAGDKIMEMKRFENAGGMGEVGQDQDQETDFNGGRITEGSFRVIYGDDEAKEMGQKTERASGSTGVGTGQITAAKVFGVAIGALKNAAEDYPEMTAPEMLVAAKAMKDMIIGEIEKELIKMATPE